MSKSKIEKLTVWLINAGKWRATFTMAACMYFAAWVSTLHGWWLLPSLLLLTMLSMVWALFAAINWIAWIVDQGKKDKTA